MEYEKQTWVTGNRITAEKLNHMEDGISSAQGGGGTSEPLIVKASNNTSGTLDHTWNEIANAPSAWMEFTDGLYTRRGLITKLAQSRIEYQVEFAFPSEGAVQLMTVFTANTADDYPSYSQE